MGVDGARVDLEGILHDGDDRRDGRKGQNDAEQQQDHVVRLGKEGLDLIENDGGLAGAKSRGLVHGVLLFSQNLWEMVGRYIHAPGADDLELKTAASARMQRF